MTRALAIRVAAAAAALNLAFGGLLGWWFYRFASWVPVGGPTGVVTDGGRLLHQRWGFREYTAVDLFGNALVFGEWAGMPAEIGHAPA
jgi:hypothetical protein